jgi:hypothetical protein
MQSVTVIHSGSRAVGPSEHHGFKNQFVIRHVQSFGDRSAGFFFAQARIF